MHESVNQYSNQRLGGAYSIPKYFPDDNTLVSASVSASKQRSCTVCPTKSSSGVLEEASPMLFCRNLPRISCLFLLLTTNLLAQAFCKSGNCFAWQGISLERNNGSSCEIWQQGLTFGSLCLLPRLIYVSRLCPVPHQEEVLQENQI